MALTLKLRLEDALHDFPEAVKGQAIEKKPKPGREALAKYALTVMPMNQQNPLVPPIHQELPVHVVRGIVNQPAAAPLFQSIPNLANLSLDLGVYTQVLDATQLTFRVPENCKLLTKY
jgi:hypothetical protein